MDASIFLTAKDQSMDEAKGFALGAADYIHKPFSPPILLARVATHLTLRQNMEELEAYGDTSEGPDNKPFIRLIKCD